MKKIIFHILTLFPEMFESVFASSILSRAQKKGIIEINYYNLRDFANDRHKTVDDTPYGGGPGMVLKIDVMDRAVSAIRSQVTGFGSQDGKPSPLRAKRLSEPGAESSPSQAALRAGGRVLRTILMTPQGRRFDQKKATELSKSEDIILICGHYEGFDERIREHLVDEEISIGDFVLSGGEIPAMAVLDAVARLVPGVLGKDESAGEESFSLTGDDGKILLEYPIYTRPVEYKGWKVPEVLQNGNHAEIKKWRLEEAKKRTKEKRPDLFN